MVPNELPPSESGNDVNEPDDLYAWGKREKHEAQRRLAARAKDKQCKKDNC